MTTPKYNRGPANKKALPKGLIVDEEDGGESRDAETKQLERQYYWLQLFEFKILPRISTKRGDGSNVPSPATSPKTTSDTVHVTVRALGKTRPSRKRRAGMAPPTDAVDTITNPSEKRRRT